ncbi:MAG: hypothetical protein J4F49_13545 [Rhodobacteraceae bacterium]|nr:hypothetical protein [Paracoccaceae bacterium]
MGFGKRAVAVASGNVLFDHAYAQVVFGTEIGKGDICRLGGAQHGALVMLHPIHPRDHCCSAQPPDTPLVEAVLERLFVQRLNYPGRKFISSPAQGHRRFQ